MQQVELPSARLSSPSHLVGLEIASAGAGAARQTTPSRANDKRMRRSAEAPRIKTIWWPPNLDGILMATPDDRTD